MKWSDFKSNRRGADICRITAKDIEKKINNLVKDIERGYTAGDNILNGIGDPELLKGNMQGFISRTINQRDRLIYRIRDGVLEIVACYGHYNDK